MTLKELTIHKLNKRGVDINSMATIVFKLQKKYNPKLLYKDCIYVIEKVLEKREVIQAVLLAINIDELTEQDMFDTQLNNLIKEDNSLFGLDEILALSIVNIYGSIAFTNFGYLDKVKPNIIGKLDKTGKQKKQCHTFLDDIVSAIIASGCSKLAHNQKN